MQLAYFRKPRYDIDAELLKELFEMHVEYDMNSVDNRTLYNMKYLQALQGPVVTCPTQQLRFKPLRHRCFNTF